MSGAMRLVTRRDRIRGVAAAWAHQYRRFIHGPNEDLPTLHGASGPRRTKREILGFLQALDVETCTEADVTACIGNSSWTYLRCTECKTDPEVALVLNPEPDYEESTFVLCPACLLRAFALMESKS